MLLPKNYNEKLINGFAGYEIKDLKSPEAVVPVSVLLQSLAEQQKTMAEQQADESLDCWKAAEGLHKNGLAVMGEALNKQHQTSLEQWRSMLMPMMLFVLVLGIIIGGLVTYVLMRPSPSPSPVAVQQQIQTLTSQVSLVKARSSLTFDSHTVNRLRNYDVPSGETVVIEGYDILVQLQRHDGTFTKAIPGYGIVTVNSGRILDISFRSYPIVEPTQKVLFSGAGMVLDLSDVDTLKADVRSHNGKVIQL